MSTCNLPMAVTTADVSSPPNALDWGLRLMDWDESDPDGFTAAVRENVDDDDVMEVVIALILNRPVQSSPRWVERMEKALHQQVLMRKRWVLDWVEARQG